MPAPKIVEKRQSEIIEFLAELRALGHEVIRISNPHYSDADGRLERYVTVVYREVMTEGDS